MKTIFRYTNVGLLLAAIMALGAVATLAQDPCTDAEGQVAANDNITKLFKDRSIAGRKAYVAAGKAFLEKYGTCEPTKDLSDYLKPRIPREEENIRKMEEEEAKRALLKRFDTGLNNKNWDDVYAAGKEILQKYPDEFRAAELVLGSIGLDETAKTPKVTKWNDDTLKYAKLSIADLEGAKEFKTLGVNQFTYKTKEDALGWMNYTIGYIYFFDKNDKKTGLSYLYKATQLNSDTKSNPIVYGSIGSYYFDEVKKLVGEVTALEAKQDPNATPEVQKALVDEIKAKVALVNGTAEAAIDAYARAHSLAKADTVKFKKEFTDGLYTQMQNLYNVRFGKLTGFDVFVSNIVKKPMPNPTLPVTPISDPEPVAAPTGQGTSVGAASGTGLGTPSGTGLGTPSGNGIGKPAGSTTTTTKPATTPAKSASPIKPGAKRQTSVKKLVAKRKVA
jgi:hypothetical protein